MGFMEVERVKGIESSSQGFYPRSGHLTGAALIGLSLLCSKPYPCSWVRCVCWIFLHKRFVVRHLQIQDGYARDSLLALHKNLRRSLFPLNSIAHKIARIVYNMLKHGEAYVQQGLESAEKKFKDAKLKMLQRSAKDLGFELIEKQILT